MKRKPLPRRHEVYGVGYKRPPKHTQFKRGVSGNPKGRPKGTKNLKTDLLEEISETISISEGGKTRKVSKQRAIIKRMVTNALNGQARSIDQIVKLILTLISTEQGQESMKQILAEDAKILELFIKQNAQLNQHISRRNTK